MKLEHILTTCMDAQRILTNMKIAFNQMNKTIVRKIPTMIRLQLEYAKIMWSP